MSIEKYTKINGATSKMASVIDLDLRLKWIYGFAVVWVLLVSTIAVSIVLLNPEKIEKLGQSGDFFAGWTNPVLAGLTLAGLVLTLSVQVKQNQVQHAQHLDLLQQQRTTALLDSFFSAIDRARNYSTVKNYQLLQNLMRSNADDDEFGTAMKEVRHCWAGAARCIRIIANQDSLHPIGQRDVCDVAMAVLTDVEQALLILCIAVDDKNLSLQLLEAPDVNADKNTPNIRQAIQFVEAFFQRRRVP